MYADYKLINNKNTIIKIINQTPNVRHAQGGERDLDKAVYFLNSPETPLSKKTKIKLNFSFLKGSTFEMDYFCDLIDNGDEEELIHPAYYYLLNTKWRKMKIIYYKLLFIMFVLTGLVFLLVIFEFVANCTKFENNTQRIDEFIVCNSSLVYYLEEIFSINIYKPEHTQRVSWILWIASIVLEIILGKIFNKLEIAGNTKWELENLTINSFIILTFFLIPYDFKEIQLWQNYVGAIMAFIGGLNLIFVCKEISFFYLYVFMCKLVIKICLNLFIVFIFPFIGISICFIIIFPYLSTLSDISKIFSITFTFLAAGSKTEFLNYTMSLDFYQVCAQFMFISIVLFISIGQMKQIIAVVIGDTKDLQKTAAFEHDIRKTRLCRNLEELMDKVSLKKMVSLFPNDSENGYTFTVEKKYLPKDLWKSLYDIASMKKSKKHD